MYKFICLLLLQSFFTNVVFAGPERLLRSQIGVQDEVQAVSALEESPTVVLGGGVSSMVFLENGSSFTVGHNAYITRAVPTWLVCRQNNGSGFKLVNEEGSERTCPEGRRARIRTEHVCYRPESSGLVRNLVRPVPENRRASCPNCCSGEYSNYQIIPNRFRSSVAGVVLDNENDANDVEKACIVRQREQLENAYRNNPAFARFLNEKHVRINFSRVSRRAARWHGTPKVKYDNGSLDITFPMIDQECSTERLATSEQILNEVNGQLDSAAEIAIFVLGDMNSEEFFVAPGLTGLGAIDDSESIGDSAVEEEDGHNRSRGAPLAVPGI